jgi:hypothetical protein
MAIRIASVVNSDPWENRYRDFPDAYVTVITDDVVGFVRSFGMDAEIGAHILIPNLDRPWAVSFDAEIFGAKTLRFIVEGE